MVGVFYYEIEQYQKSLACFMKALSLSNKLTLAAADCHFNQGIVWKKLGYLKKAVGHLEAALEIRREKVGGVSLTVSDVLEVLGKFYIELKEYRKAYKVLQECYETRKRLLQESTSKMKRDKN